MLASHPSPYVLNDPAPPPPPPRTFDSLHLCADCAVCEDGFAPGVLNSCHECSGESRRSAVVLATFGIILTVVAGAFLVSHLLQVDEYGRDANGETVHEVRPTMCKTLATCRNTLVNVLPLSAVRIAVVVLQIITQVRAPEILLSNTRGNILSRFKRRPVGSSVALVLVIV